jgi:hypothetical protein
MSSRTDTSLRRFDDLSPNIFRDNQPIRAGQKSAARTYISVYRVRAKSTKDYPSKSLKRFSVQAMKRLNDESPNRYKDLVASRSVEELL